MDETGTALGDERKERRELAAARPATRMRRNLLSLLLSQSATQLVTLATLCVVPRFLGVQTYGELAFATTFVGFFSLVSSLGSRQYLVKQIARRPDRLPSYVINGFAMKVAIGIPLAAAACLGSILLGYSSTLVLLVVAGGIGMLLSILSDVIVAALQGIDRMGPVGLWTAIQQYLAGAIGILLVVEGQGVVWYALIIAVGPLVQIVANGRLLWPHLRGHLAIDLRVWKEIAFGGIPFALWNAVLLVYGSIDIVMLHQMAGTPTVGWYTLAYTWVGVPVAFPTILTTVVFPALSTSALSDRPDFVRLVNKAVSLVVLVGTPIAVGTALIAGNIIADFHYPSDFSHTIPLIRILAVHIPIVGMDMVLALALVAVEKQVQWLLVGCLAAVLNPLLNLLAIPWSIHRYGNGAIGAAIVTVATEVFMMIGAVVLRPAGVLDRTTLGFVLRSVLASVSMIPVVIFLAGSTLAGRVLAGAATLLVGSLLLRTIRARSCLAAALDTFDLIRRRDHLGHLSSPVEQRT